MGYVMQNEACHACTPLSVHRHARTQPDRACQLCFAVQITWRVLGVATSQQVQKAGIMGCLCMPQSSCLFEK